MKTAILLILTILSSTAFADETLSVSIFNTTGDAKNDPFVQDFLSGKPDNIKLNITKFTERVLRAKVKVEKVFDTTVNIKPCDKDKTVATFKETKKQIGQELSGPIFVNIRKGKSINISFCKDEISGKIFNYYTKKENYQEVDAFPFKIKLDSGKLGYFKIKENQYLIVYRNNKTKTFYDR